jgi:prepilin-type N-terminal cleavage/methylation domain-containing protein
MKRNAFSLIELIFVMLILGILSAVAIVKSTSMTERAREAKLQSFAGTLNRSVGGALWLKSMQDNRDGSVAYANYDAQLANYVQMLPQYSFGPALINCNSAGDGVFLRYLFAKTYEVHCKDGSKTTSPDFRVFNVTDGLYLD